MVEAAAPDAEFTRVIFDELGLRSALTVPLRARGRLFGALILVSAESDRIFDERDVAFAEDFATHAALAVANARLYAEQQEIAQTLQRSLLPRAAARPAGRRDGAAATARPASTTWSAATSTTSGRSARAASASPSATCAGRAPRPRR